MTLEGFEEGPLVTRGGQRSLDGWRANVYVMVPHIVNIVKIVWAVLRDPHFRINCSETHLFFIFIEILCVCV